MTISVSHIGMTQPVNVVQILMKGTGLSLNEAKALLDRLVEEGRLDLPEWNLEDIPIFTRTQLQNLGVYVTGSTSPKRIEDWIEVTVAADEYRTEVVGYYPDQVMAEQANHRGWYGAYPSYFPVKVIRVDNEYYKVIPIKIGKVEK